MKTKDKEQMIIDHLGLAGMVARKYIGAKREYDDLFQVGCIGLMKAADKFDPSRGFAFSTLAVRIIHTEIFYYMRSQKKHDGLISLHAPLKSTESMMLQDIIGDDLNLELEAVENVQYFRYLDNLKAVQFNDYEKECMRLSSKGFRQNYIGTLTGISQTQVSRHLRSAKKKVHGLFVKEGVV